MGEQSGLRLVPQEVLLEMLIIDKIDRPEVTLGEVMPTDQRRRIGPSGAAA
jgi:hypothetical protein